MENKLGQEPAFPYDPHNYSNGEKGMSKRFYAACSAMQGILSYPGAINNSLYKDAKSICKIAYEIADELLKQENETESE
jgi:hypothetical protein